MHHYLHIIIHELIINNNINCDNNINITYEYRFIYRDSKTGRVGPRPVGKKCGAD